MKEETESYGKAVEASEQIIVKGTGKEYDIQSFVQAEYSDHRLISVLKIGDGDFIISVENPPSSGRGSSNMRLSQDSMIGIAATILMFCRMNDIELEKALAEAATSGEIKYSASNNLKPFQP